MSRRLLIGVLCVVLVVLCSPSLGATEDEPRFQMGFRLLADMIPDLVGPPLEDERHNALNGDGLQMTARGLMVWRKADNWTAFTNGWWTWVNGPYGLQDRPNYERFEWEGDSASHPAALESPRPPEPSLSLVSDPTLSAVPTVSSGGEGTPTVLAPVPVLQVTPIVAVEPTSTPAPVPTSSPEATATSAPVPTQTTVPTVRPTDTPRPTNTTAPTATTRPTSTPQPTATTRPTATQPAGGIRSPEPAGNWVTSVHSTTQYYCSSASSYWKTWSAANRIWFQTEAALLSAYPNRTRHD